MTKEKTNWTGILTAISIIGNVCLGIALLAASGWADRNLLEIEPFKGLDAIKFTAHAPESATLCFTLSKYDGQTFQLKQASPTLRSQIKEFTKVCNFYSSGDFEAMSISIRELDLDER